MLTVKKTLRILLVMGLCFPLAGCDDPQVYGSIGVSSYHGYSGYNRVGGSISVGGRIY